MTDYEALDLTQQGQHGAHAAGGPAAGTPGYDRSPYDQQYATAGSGPAGDASLGEIVGKLTSDLSRLMQAELQLAKAEAKEEVAHAGRGAGMLAGAGAAGNLLLVFASLALMFGLGHWMALGWAALIVAVIWAIVAAALASSGRAALKTVNPSLPETTQTLKEDAQWARKPRG